MLQFARRTGDMDSAFFDNSSARSRRVTLLVASIRSTESLKLSLSKFFNSSSTIFVTGNFDGISSDILATLKIPRSVHFISNCLNGSPLVRLCSACVSISGNFCKLSLSSTVTSREIHPITGRRSTFSKKILLRVPSKTSPTNSAMVRHQCRSLPYTRHVSSCFSQSSIMEEI